MVIVFLTHLYLRTHNCLKIAHIKNFENAFQQHKGMWIGLTPLLVAVHVGALHKILNSLFDLCKVMAHIALDEDTKV